MRESTKVTKKRKLESPIIHGRPQNFFQGCKINMLFIIFKLLTISVPSKIILNWANICFSEHDYFRTEWVEFSVNYKLCELHDKYTWSLKKKALHCHGFQLNKNYYSLLSKQGRTQLIYSTELKTEHVFENFGRNSPIALPLIAGSAARLVRIT